jgi:hypothetical protein
MTVKVSKYAYNLLENANHNLGKDGIAGNHMLAADTHRQQFVMIGAGRKNMIINGDMRISQRTISENGLTTEGHSAVDLFGYNMFQAGSCVRTVSQEQLTSSTASPPHDYSQKVLYTTAQTTNSNCRQQIRYMVEGSDMSELRWGHHQAKPATLSFWAKSNVSGDHAVSVINQAETHSFVTSYNIGEPNVWEYKEVSIDGNTEASWNTDNQIGIRLAWDNGSGSDYETSNINKWAAQWKFRPTNCVRIAEHTGGYLELTGVQLEIGSRATPFEYRPLQSELTLVQRYVEWSGYPIPIQGFQSSYQYYQSIQFSNRVNTNDVPLTVPFKVQKRSTPSVTIYNPNNGTANQVFHTGPNTNISVASNPGKWAWGNGYINVGPAIPVGSRVYFHYLATSLM